MTLPKPPAASEQMVAQAISARPLLISAAAVLVLAALAEFWRYVLLLRSRAELLPARTVAISDSVVVSAGVVAPVVVVLAVVTCTRWLIQARHAAAARIGRRDGRGTRSVVLAVVLPVWNLVMPGVLITELERDSGAPSPPSRLLRWWWLSWVASVVLAVGVWLLRLRHTVQAQADGVLLAALSDLLAATTVVLTLLVLQRCTEALGGAAAYRVRRARRSIASVPSAAAGTT